MELRTWFNLLCAASKREEGQTMAEYGVVLAVITVGIIAALTALAVAVTGKLGVVTRIHTSVTSEGAVSGRAPRRMRPARTFPRTHLPTTERSDMDLRDWHHLLRTAAASEEGQTMSEYGVVLAFVTLGVIGAIGLLAVAISGKLGDVTALLTPVLP